MKARGQENHERNKKNPERSQTSVCTWTMLACVCQAEASLLSFSVFDREGRGRELKESDFICVCQSLCVSL